MLCYPDIENAVVVVTGGASGIGAEIVKAFARQKARVACLDIDDSAAAMLQAEIGNSDATVKFISCDLRNTKQLRDCCQRIGEQWGAASVLVNNAARDDRHSWEDVTEDYYDERIATNLRHMFFATQALAPGMISAGGGSIINLGSNSWWEASGGMPVYTSAKAAVHGMTRSFARDLGPHNIRVNTIVPGWVMTARQKELWVTEDSLNRALQRQCLPTPIEPEYIANMALFLGSAQSAMCTAHNFMVDAGSI